MEKLVKQILGHPQKRIRWSWPQNWVIKLLSLLFAIFLWYFVVGEDKVDMTVHIPVEIVNLPRNLVISNQFKKQLEVTVSGPRGLIRGITNQHISRAVDLSKATPGTELVRNDEDSIPFPRGIRVLRIQPPYITLLLDRLIQKEFQIKALTSGKPVPNYQVTAINLEPPSLVLTGPQALLDPVKELRTAPIDISDLNSSVIKQTPLDLSPAVAELIGETAVTAKITITEKTVSKSISNLPVVIVSEGPPRPATVKPARVSLQAEIPISLLKTEDLHSQFKVSVGTNGLPPGQHTVSVKVNTNSQLKVTEVTPPTVTLIIGTNKPAK